jgi:hypothetical protein
MKPFLIDGPLLQAPERRAMLIEYMAADLLETGAFVDRSESEKQLHRDGYLCLDVMILVDDARQVAMQEAVAREMSEP